MTRLARSAIVIEYNGKGLKLKQLAGVTGLTYHCLVGRYQSGDRGGDLVRPLGAKSSRQLERARLKAEEAAKSRKEVGSARHHHAKPKPKNQEREETRLRKLHEVREQHSAVFSQSLIAANLLSNKEREQIRQSIVGRQRWWTADSAYTGR